MKKKAFLFLSILFIFCIITACGKSDDNGIADPDGNIITQPVSSPIPSAVPSATPTAVPSPSPTPSPSPSPSPTPTPVPTFKDIITETDEPGVYSVPLSDIEGYFLNVHSFDDRILYFTNEGVETPPVIISYNISTGESERKVFEEIEPYKYNYEYIPGKYIVIIESSTKFTYLDKDLNVIHTFEIPINSIELDYIPNADYSSIYYFKGTSLIEYSAATGEEKELMTDTRFKGAHPIDISPDSKYLFFSMYTRQTGYYKKYIFDLQNNELITPDEDGISYYYSVSPDGKEFFATTKFDTKAGLYTVKDDLSDMLYLLNSGREIPNELLKTDLNIKHSIGYKNIFVDWERRMIISSESFMRNSVETTCLTCYSLDTGEPISNYAFTLENPLLQNTTLSFNPTDGYMLLSGAHLKDTYCYAWEYSEDTLENESIGFIRYNYIPAYLDEYRRELEQKYNVYIYLGSEIFATNLTYRLSYSDDYKKQYETLHMIDEIFSLYPEDIFDQMKFDGIKTIGIYLCSGFTKTDSYGIDDAAAVAGTDGYERFLALDITSWGDLRRNIVHEISHWIDKRIDFKSDSTDEYNFDLDWNSNNPDDYYYMFDYNAKSPFGRYTYKYDAPEKAYFIDEYSLTYPTEDRARLFEFLIRYSGIEYFKSEHLRLKLHTYFDYIRKCYDTANWPEETFWEHKLKMLDRLYSGDETVTLEDIYPEYYDGDIEYSIDDEGYGFLEAYSDAEG